MADPLLQRASQDQERAGLAAGAVIPVFVGNRESENRNGLQLRKVERGEQGPDRETDGGTLLQLRGYAEPRAEGTEDSCRRGQIPVSCRQCCERKR